jgi:hypothetical protein
MVARSIPKEVHLSASTQTLKVFALAALAAGFHLLAVPPGPASAG